MTQDRMHPEDLRAIVAGQQLASFTARAKDGETVSIPAAIELAGALLEDMPRIQAQPSAKAKYVHPSTQLLEAILRFEGDKKKDECIASLTSENLRLKNALSVVEGALERRNMDLASFKANVRRWIKALGGKPDATMLSVEMDEVVAATIRNQEARLDNKRVREECAHLRLHIIKWIKRLGVDARGVVVAALPALLDSEISRIVAERAALRDAVVPAFKRFPAPPAPLLMPDSVLVGPYPDDPTLQPFAPDIYYSPGHKFTYQGATWVIRKRGQA